MARPKKTTNGPKSKRRSKALVQFTALQIEGGILSPSVLSKIAQFEAGMQSEADYQIPKGLALRDEIGRYWRIASAQYGAFRASGRSLDFVKSLFRDVFQFKFTDQVAPIMLSDRAFPITALLNSGSVPLIIADSTEGLDSLQPKFGDTGKKRTAFGLLQEFLNAEDACLWGIASDGNTIRIARDNSSLTRPAWIEADLRRIFEEEHYADFAVLWLLMHATSFSEKTPAESRIEKWREQGREEGARASEKLRLGVEEALKILGDGFIKHQKNTELRRRVLTGEVIAQQYYQELLRLVYRMIFLLTVEERERLHPKGTLKKPRDLYFEGYSMIRIRTRAIRRTAYDRYGDLWDGLKITFRGLARGETRLGLPALGGLFGEDQTPTILDTSIENRFLLSAVRCLSWLEEEDGLSKVNWRDMGPEELGSVYESLLELVPQFVDSGNGFRFANVEDSKGNQRKTSGSYYTPDSLVQSLLDSALEPVIEDTIRKNPAGADRALLKLSIIDPACGSGHFLLGAARRLAVHVARIRAQGTPTAEEFEKALRQVISKCIYGVDRNPMALELARTALWLEAVSPDAPLSFLDHHLVCGDGLLGLIDLSVLKDGIPQEAFKALEGDDSRTVKVLSDQNKETLKGIKSGRDADLFTQSFENFKPAVVEEWIKIQEMPDDTLEAVENKKKAFQKYQQTAWNVSSDPIGLAADMYVAAFMARKTQPDAMKIPTSEHLGKVLSGAKIDESIVRFVREQARRHRFLHWKLKFPDVFKKGGFEVVLGNPPWERIKLQEEEFFSSRDPAIANARNKAERQRLIDGLSNEPMGSAGRQLFESFVEAKHEAEATSVFAHQECRYPLTGTGDVNTYALFAETFLNLLSKTGRSGVIVPSGIASDDTTKAFFGHISSGKLVSLIDFENRKGIFPGVHKSFKFCLLTLGLAPSANLSFFLTDTSQIGDKRRRFSLTPEEFSLLNPNTKTCPIFRSQYDAELTKKIYKRVPVLINETIPEGNPWGVSFARLFDMATDSDCFRTKDRLKEMKEPVPLYEAKMIHQFDHRFATYADDSNEGARDVTPEEKADPNFRVTPRYWVERSEVEERLAKKNWPHPWLMGWRDITNSTNERTVIASLVPRVGVGDKFLLMFPKCSIGFARMLCLLADQNCLVHDFVARQKLGGTSFKYHYKKQVATLPPSAYSDAHLEFIVPRVLALIWPSSLKYELETIPDVLRFIVNETEFHNARYEIDAFYFARYGLSREEVSYVLDPSNLMGEDYPSETFGVLMRKELKAHGEYRTRRLVLEAWDRMKKEGALPVPVTPWTELSI
jgi:hypothetical protein